jgi:hypothetical protein
MLDGDRSGLGAIRPVTRTLRGTTLLPYWAITGLTAGGALARTLALLGLSVGGVLLILALFGNNLPSVVGAAAAAVGVGALLGAFGYSALRSGSLLHGIVLLTPVVPLIAYALARADKGSGSAPGAVTVVGLLGLVVALMILGSIPSPTRSVPAALDERARKRAARRPPRVPAEGVETSADGPGQASAQPRSKWLERGGALLTWPPLLIVLMALVEIPQLCSVEFLTCERSV